MKSSLNLKLMSELWRAGHLLYECLMMLLEQHYRKVPFVWNRRREAVRTEIDAGRVIDRSVVRIVNRFSGRARGKRVEPICTRLLGFELDMELGQ